MTTIKTYTDLQQSRKLAEILPLESADMCYKYYSGGMITGYGDCVLAKSFITGKNVIRKNDLPCWSLAALLGVLPFHLIVNNQIYAFSMHKGLNKDGETYMIRYNIFNTDICLYKTEYYNNPVDACYEMIIRLHELNLIYYDKGTDAN